MDRLPPLRLLSTFEAVARLGSMREAASRLNVTQPAVTQAIRALEEHVGTALLDRGTRPARLTEAGHQLARATRDGLGLIEDALGEIRAGSATAEPQLTVCCTLGMATYWLMPRLPEFYASNPDLPVNVQAPPTDLPTLSPGIDLALRYGTGRWSDGTTVKLFGEEVCPVGRPELVDRLLRAGTALEEAPLIHVRSLNNPHWLGWAEYLTRCGRRRPRRAGQSFDNYVHAVQAVLDGRGLMLGWRSITASLVAEGALIPWPGGTLELQSGYYVTLSPGGAAKPGTAAFLDWLQRTSEPG